MHSKTPLVITKSYKKVTESWREKLSESRMLYTSQAENLGKSEKYDTVLSLEGISFDVSLKTEHLKSLLSSVVPLDHIGVVDLGGQYWNLKQLNVLTDWLSQAKSIHFLRFGQANMPYDVWCAFCRWLIEKRLFVKNLDMGSSAMSLPRVRKLAEVLSCPGVIEKFDLSESRWMHDHVKALLWSLNTTPLAVKRLSLGSADITDESVVLLFRHVCVHSQTCEIFSTGVYTLGEKALGQCLDFLSQGSIHLYACLFNKQFFSADNLNKLYHCINHATGLKRMAIMECDWDNASTMPTVTNTANGVEKIYFERSVEHKVGLMSRLIALGYLVDKEVNANAAWLSKKSS